MSLVEWWGKYTDELQNTAEYQSTHVLFEFSLVLYEKMHELGIDAQQLSERTKLNIIVIDKALCGDSISIDHIFRLAHELGIKINVSFE